MNLNAAGIFFPPVFIATAVFLPIYFLHILYFIQQILFLSPSITTRDTVQYIFFIGLLSVYYIIVYSSKRQAKYKKRAPCRDTLW